MMLFLLLLVSMFAGWDKAEAQLYAPVLAPSRAATWENTIFTPPDTSSWAHCTGSPVNPPSSSVALQQIIDNCGTATDAGNRKIVLNAGTFVLNTGLDISKSNLVIIGQGANQTFLQLGPRGCHNQTTGICIHTGHNGNYYEDGGGTPVISPITAGATQGSTSLTVTNAGSLSIGDGIIVRQQNEDNRFNYAPYPTCDFNFSGDMCTTNSARIVAQQTVIVNKTPAGCTTCTITIQQPLYFPGWKQSLSPEIWSYGSTVINTTPPIKQFIRNVGIENVHTVATWCAFTSCGTNSYGQIEFNRVTGGWVRGSAIAGCDTGCISALESTRILYQNNYLYQNRGVVTANQSTLYGFYAYFSTDVAIINNITQQIQAPIMLVNNVHGAVVGYNFTRNQVAANGCPTACIYVYNFASAWPSHASGASMILIEGHDANTVIVELDHGASSNFTVFRSFLTGFDKNNGLNPCKPFTPFDFQSISGRFSNFIGNVLGTPGAAGAPGVQNNYESSGGPHGQRGISAGCGAPGTGAIYRFGNHGEGEATGTLANGASGYDSVVEQSSYRWGNFDTVTNAVRYCGTSANTGWAANCGRGNSVGTPFTEVPSGQFVPTSEASSIPTSLAFATKPSWFGSRPWPLNGPNVSGGDISGYGGRANKNPARICYEVTMAGPADGTGAERPFNADQCYGNIVTPPPDTTAPAVPTGLSISGG